MDWVERDSGANQADGVAVLYRFKVKAFVVKMVSN
jgi:hypothetical protein